MLFFAIARQSVQMDTLLLFSLLQRSSSLVMLVFLSFLLHHHCMVCVLSLQACLTAVENITSERGAIDKSGLLLLCQLPDGSRGKLFTQLRNLLLPMRDDPVVTLLTLKDNKHGPTMEDLFNSAEINDDPEVSS